jgi:hypothetical protein
LWEAIYLGLRSDGDGVFQAAGLMLPEPEYATGDEAG